MVILRSWACWCLVYVPQSPSRHMTGYRDLNRISTIRSHCQIPCTCTKHCLPVSISTNKRFVQTCFDELVNTNLTKFSPFAAHWITARPIEKCNATKCVLMFAISEIFVLALKKKCQVRSSKSTQTACCKYIFTIHSFCLMIFSSF